MSITTTLTETNRITSSLTETNRITSTFRVVFTVVAADGVSYAVFTSGDTVTLTDGTLLIFTS